MSDDHPERFHGDPANWRLGIFYVCREDSRLIVPKRIEGLGWTLNFGRPFAVPFLLLIIAIIPAALYVARYFGAGDDVRLAIKVLLAAGIIALLYRISRQPRRPQKQPDSENHGA